MIVTVVLVSQAFGASGFLRGELYRLAVALGSGGGDRVPRGRALLESTLRDQNNQ